MLDNKALAQFAIDMAGAYTRLAERLREPEARPHHIMAGPELVEILPGYRQRAVYEYLKGEGGEGKLTREVNDGIGYDFSNTYTTLHRLKNMGIVELIPGVRPQRWRLSAQYRDEAS
jgi:hypothetical protein